MKLFRVSYSVSYNWGSRHVGNHGAGRAAIVDQPRRVTNKLLLEWEFDIASKIDKDGDVKVSIVNFQRIK